MNFRKNTRMFFGKRAIRRIERIWLKRVNPRFAPARTATAAMKSKSLVSSLSAV